MVLSFEVYCVDFLTIAMAIPPFSSTIFLLKCPQTFEDLSAMELVTPEGNNGLYPINPMNPKEVGFQPPLSADISNIYIYIYTYTYIHI